MRRGRKHRLSKRKLGISYYYEHFYFRDKTYLETCNKIYKCSLRDRKKVLFSLAREEQDALNSMGKSLKLRMLKLFDKSRENALNMYNQLKIEEEFFKDNKNYNDE